MSSPSLSAVALAIALAFVAGPTAAQPAPAPSESPAVAGTVVVAAALKDDSGKPLPGVTVRLRDAGGSVVGIAVSDANGNLQFPPLTAGTYAFDADGLTLNDATRTVVVTAQGPASVALVGTRSTTLATVHVVAQRLNQARQNLAPDIGADVYEFSRTDIQNLPAGNDTPLNQVLLQAPGVVQDSYGALHIRGDHGNLQYRINDIIVPESIGGFGQTLQVRFADKISLITGALPAQYGYRTAGVVAIDTKGGALDEGGHLGIMGGSHDTQQIYGDLGGAAGDFTYYITGSLLKNNLGIEAPTSDPNPIHDQTKQANGFGYFSYHLSNDARLSLIVGAANNRFQIPNIPGQDPVYTLAGAPDLPSSQLNQNQTEKTNYTALALQGTYNDQTDYQIAVFHRYTSVSYMPDPVGDLIYTGVAGQIYRQNEAYGLQADASYRLNGKNTLRTGLYFSHERLTTDNTSQVFPADADGNQTSTVPFTIVDNTGGTSRLFGIYLQDEWKPMEKVTVNYGIRYDRLNAFAQEDQWSPRLGAVWQATPTTTLHAGYANYFTPPPSELITSSTIDKFVGTTNAPPSTLNSPVQSERSNYFDVGLNQRFTSAFTLGIDGYYKQVKDLLDEGQFGSAILFTPFNYDQGKVYGIELAANYRDGNFNAYANFTASKAQGKNIVSSQYTFDPDELAYIQNHWIYLDHNQTYSASAGASYLWQRATFSVSAIYGSGLRAGFRQHREPPVVCSGRRWGVFTLHLPGLGKFNARFTIINVFDRSYEIRDGTGVGVGAPQFGPRRAFYVALEKPFGN